jgi:hypothetical protein
MMVLLVFVATLFGLFIGHVCGFGVRTRHIQLHTKPQTRRDQRDRQSVGFWGTHPLNR